MRNKNLNRIRILSLGGWMSLLSVVSCSPAPEAQKVETGTHVGGIQTPPDTLGKRASSKKAVWIDMTNAVTGGFLSRLDLQTGEIKHKMRMVGPDTILKEGTWVLNDHSGNESFQGEDQFFLLNRNRQDSLVILKGKNAEIEAQTSFEEGSNPQDVIRDSQGKVWVSFLDNNSVRVLSPDLKSTLSQIPLDRLVEENSKDHLAELGSFIRWGDHQLVVFAQRIDRDLGDWIPEKKSGLAVLNTQRFEVDSIQFPEVLNPIYLFQSSNGLGVIGAGILSNHSHESGQKKILSMSNNSESYYFDSVVEQKDYRFKVLKASYDDESKQLFLLAWYPELNKSCIQSEESLIFCLEGDSENQGYLFSDFIYVDNHFILSYVGSSQSQIWIVSGDEKSLGKILDKINMPIPVVSMIAGP